MANYKSRAMPITTSIFPVEQDYETKLIRFEKDQSRPSTGQTIRAGGYNLFVSDKGELIGSYSITSRQESYRTLNLNLLSKVSRR